MSNKRVAVCLSGEARTFKDTYKSLTKFLPNADIFIYTWNTSKNSWKDTIQGFKLVEQVVTEEELRDVYKPTRICVVDHPSHLQIENVHLPLKYKGKCRADKISPQKHNYLPMYWGIYKADLLRQTYSSDYDIVVRSRPDIEIISDLELYHGSGVYYTPMNPLDGTDVSVWSQWRANDFFAYGDLLSMELYSSRFCELTHDWNTEVPENGNILSSEESLKKYLDARGVRTHPIFPDHCTLVRELLK